MTNNQGSVFMFSGMEIMMNSELKEKLLSSGYVVDNEWLDKYVELIASHINDAKVMYQTHSHHILPVSYFTSSGLEVDDSRSNRVNLSYKNHMIAHLYLSGCTTGQNRYKNLYSLLMMSHFDEEGYLDITNYDKYEYLYSSAISAAPNHRKGTKCSEETRARMSIASKRKVEEHGSSYNKGSLWIHKGDDEKMIFECDLIDYLQQGYEKGRAYRHDAETLAKISEAGRHKVITDEFREKMREIGRLSSLNRDPESYRRMGEAVREYYKTHVNPFKGKHHTEESLRKNKEAHLGRKKICKEGVIKVVRPQDIDSYLSEGWVLVQNKECPKTTDWIFITNGDTNKKIHEYEFDEWADKGFRKGVTQHLKK